jgi:hypothetical protein
VSVELRNKPATKNQLIIFGRIKNPQGDFHVFVDETNVDIVVIIEEIVNLDCSISSAYEHF